ncbi:hypothetical protein [Pararhodobacter sp.]|uniref:hypothetical protein n=1 Tax=Pararhodobacter sp. TaxID=2127056 RepID=UPI002FE41509
MCPRLALLLALVLPLAAQAEPLTPGGSPRQPIAAISGDWNGDEALDAAFLYPGADGLADLVVMINNQVTGLETVLALPGVVWSGPMAGQAPAFEPRSETSFAIRSEQTGIGRTPWHQWVTLAWRDGGFVVAGYDYSFYDRLDLSHYGECSVNLLTGAYTLTHGPGDEVPEITRQGSTEERGFPLADLREGWQARACDDLFR